MTTAADVAQRLQLPDESPIWTALAEACRAEAVPIESAELVHLGHTAGFALPRAQLFAKVSGLADDGSARRAVTVSQLLHERGMPVLTPAPGHEQPRRTKYGPVTFWPLLHVTPEPVDYAWLGRTVRALHDLPTDGFPRASRTTTHALRRRKDAFFAKVCDRRMEHAVYAVVDELHRCADALQDCERSLVHGDLYPANVVTAHGRTWLLDFDSAGFGIRLLDLVTLYVAHRRFGLPQRDWAAFVSGYGYDPREHPLFQTVTRMRELGLVTWLLNFAAESPEHRFELHHRLETLHTSARWVDLAVSANSRQAAREWVESRRASA